MPSNTTIRIGEPIIFNVVVDNTETESVVGHFMPAADRFARMNVVIVMPDEKGRYYYSPSDRSVSIFFRPQTLQPGERLEGKYCMLFDMAKHHHVFNQPGQYRVVYSLRWKTSGDGPQDHATAVVNVLDWDEETEEKSIEASKLWMQQDIARAYQDGWELASDRLEDLKRLTTEYGDTVYAKWAAELLQRIERPPAVEDTAPRTLKTISGSNLDPRRLRP